MLVLTRARLAWLSMPKAGSTAMEAALAPHADIAFTGPPRIKHMTAPKFERFVRPYLESIDAPVETVAVLREPVAWLASWWRYRARPEIAGQPASTAGMPFEAFVEAYLADPQPAPARVGRPARFLGALSGRPAVDRLFAYERMDAAVALISERVGSPLTLRRCNESPGLTPDLPPGLADRLREAMAPEMALHAQLMATASP